MKKNHEVYTPNEQIMKQYFTSVVGILLISIAIQGQTINPAELDKLVNKTLEVFEVPGIAVAIIKEGKIIHSKGYGMRSLDTKEAVDENTLFGIASNSKAFTSAALSILVNENKLSWDDRVRDYIPEFRLYNSYVTEDFRRRDLLCHRSGMWLGAGDLMIWPDGTDFTREEVIHNLRFLKQVSPFRTKYDYDNLLYIVAGEIITKISGLSWEDFISTRILKPLKMDRSAPSFNTLSDKSNTIDPHAPVDGEIKVVARTSNELMNAAGGIYSSVSDMSKWVIELLGTEKQVLNRAQLEHSLWAPQTLIPVYSPGRYNTHFSAYGLGFRVMDEAGFKVISHTGGLAGMVTQLTIVPELQLGIIVFTNQQSGGAFSAITNEIKDLFFGMEENVDWIDRYAAAASVNKEMADNIVKGVWEEVNKDKVERSMVRIHEEEGKLKFQALRSPGLKGEIFHYKALTYVVKWEDRSMDADAYILFTLDIEGKVLGFTMKAISPLTDFSYDFHDLNFCFLTSETGLSSILMK